MFALSTEKALEKYTNPLKNSEKAGFFGAQAFPALLFFLLFLNGRLNIVYK